MLNAWARSLGTRPGVRGTSTQLKLGLGLESKPTFQHAPVTAHDGPGALGPAGSPIWQRRSRRRLGARTGLPHWQRPRRPGALAVHRRATSAAGCSDGPWPGAMAEPLSLEESPAPGWHCTIIAMLVLGQCQGPWHWHDSESRAPPAPCRRPDQPEARASLTGSAGLGSEWLGTVDIRA